MSCVIAVDVSMFHTVHVVSIEDVTMRLGDFSFHEKLVRGAPVLLFCTLLCCDVRMVRTLIDKSKTAWNRRPCDERYG